MKPLIRLKSIIPVFLIGLVIVCLGLSPTGQAVVPPPDGVYPNFTTAEGQNALQSLTTGAANTALGAYSLFSTTTGSFNTAVGAGALDLNTGDQNTAVGVAALLLNTGTNNTAVGVDALGLNTSGGSNAAVGAFALYNNIGGNHNTATGAFALFSNTTGHENTAIGVDALRGNTTGSENTAVGHGALTNNIDGTGNTAEGLFTLHDNTAGVENTAIGQQALAVSQASDNTATGFQALFSNDTGFGNTACGHQALMTNTTGENNTAIGFSALLNGTGSDNIAIGAGAGQNITSGDNNIDIGVGVLGSAGDVGVIRVGSPNQTAKCFIASIRGITTGNNNAIPVLIDTNGQLGTQSSSRRFKKEIQPMDKASEAILALKPVTFHYKSDKTNRPEFGLIAEEVAKVNPDLVVRDENGEIYTVRYEAVNAMLLNEFLKEHHQVQDLKGIVAEQQAQIEALTAGLQKVSAQLELNKTAPQTVLNNQ